MNSYNQVLRSFPFRNVDDEPISSRRYLLFEEVGSLIELGMILQSIVDPDNQKEVSTGLTRVTLIGVDGQEYDVIARYNRQTEQISRPA